MKRRLRLRPDWRTILKQAWSVKFMVVAAILSGCEVAVPFLAPVLEADLPKGMFAALAGVVTAGALIARLLAQSEVEKND